MTVKIQTLDGTEIDGRKYMLHGGYVLSADGDTHYVSATRLIRLYGLPAGMCVIEPRNPILAEKSKAMKQFIHMYPRSDGDYRIQEGSCGQ